jgi:hypothetical protein
MKNILYFLLAIVCLLFWQCNNDDLSGKVEKTKKTYYSNGKPLSETTMNESYIKNGVCKTYYPDGQTKSWGFYKNGKRDGYWLWYLENGAIERKDHWKNDNLFGEQLSFFENGIIKEYMFYDFLGRLVYKRTYSPESSLIKEEGKFCLIIQADKYSPKSLDTLNFRIYLPTPNDLEIKLFSSFELVGKPSKWQQIPLKYNIGFCFKKIDKLGEYNWKIKAIVKDRKTFEEKTVISEKFLMVSN